MTKGIIIYALGHSNYYRMAESLAASLICNGTKEDDIKIGVICDNPSLFKFPELIDDIIVLPRKKFTQKEKIIFNHATVLIYDLSPYDTTIKLDADMIWIRGRKPSKLFELLHDVDLTFENNGYDEIDKADRKRSVWAPPLEIKKAYNFTGEEKCYTIFGEFIYFKKSDENKLFFNTVKSIYHKPKVACEGFSNGTFTDELAFQIAIMKTGKYPHQAAFTPIYNLFLGYKHLQYKYPYQLDASYYGYSIGGNATPVWQKQQYNILANHYFSVLGLQNPYQAIHKKSFLPERQKL